MNASRYSRAGLIALMSLAGITCIPGAGADIAPTKALVVQTRENMGCLTKQSLKQDASRLVARSDGKAVMLSEIKNSEDVARRQELYLVFPAKAIKRLPGYLILRLSCASDRSQPASLALDSAVLRRKGKTWIAILKVKSNGSLHAQMLYSRRPEFVTARFSCPEADVNEPVPVTFYRAYPLEGDVGGVPSQPADQWRALELTINPVALQDAPLVDICQQLLQAMEKKFASAGAPLIWPRSRVTEKALRDLTRQVARGKIKIQVALKSDDGNVIKTGRDDFVAHLRQRLALRQPDGKLVGAQLWLWAER